MFIKCKSLYLSDVYKQKENKHIYNYKEMKQVRSESLSLTQIIIVFKEYKRMHHHAIKNSYSSLIALYVVY